MKSHSTRLSQKYDRLFWGAREEREDPKERKCSSSPSPAPIAPISLSRKSGCSLTNSLSLPPSLPPLEDVLAVSRLRHTNHAGGALHSSGAEGGSALSRSEDRKPSGLRRRVFGAVIVVAVDDEVVASPSPSRPLFHVPPLPPAH